MISTVFFASWKFEPFRRIEIFSKELFSQITQDIWNFSSTFFGALIYAFNLRYTIDSSV